MCPFAVRRPTPRDPATFFSFPSRPLISRTDDNLPPYSAGIELLNSSTSVTTSGLNAENRPNRWVGLYMVPSLKRIRFWSVAPPRTLNPPDASPTDLTPGNVTSTLSTSASPNTVGTCLIRPILTSSTPILLDLRLFDDSAETTAELREYTFSFIMISRLPVSYSLTSSSTSLREKPLAITLLAPEGSCSLYCPNSSVCVNDLPSALYTETPTNGSPLLTFWTLPDKKSLPPLQFFSRPISYTLFAKFATLASSLNAPR